MLILASRSPRRIELLKLLNLPFEVVPAVGEEKLSEDEMLCVKRNPSEHARFLAIKKANEIFENHTHCTVTGADTIVVCQNRILEKPLNHSDAVEMLELLSGKIHSVFTGVCIRQNKKNISFVEETLVEFYRLEKTEIEQYVQSGEPMDKAGSYGIQGKGSLFVKRIDGDYYNVMGLPIARLYRELKRVN